VPGEPPVVSTERQLGLRATLSKHARAADAAPDVRFGTAEAVREAATRGQDVFLLVGEADLAGHTDRLREDNVSYEIVDAAE
jgi:putative transcriptional regulator